MDNSMNTQQMKAILGLGDSGNGDGNGSNSNKGKNGKIVQKIIYCAKINSSESEFCLNLYENNDNGSNGKDRIITKLFGIGGDIAKKNDNLTVDDKLSINSKLYNIANDIIDIKKVVPKCSIGYGVTEVNICMEGLKKYVGCPYPYRYDNSLLCFRDKDLPKEKRKLRDMWLGHFDGKYKGDYNYIDLIGVLIGHILKNN